MFVSTYYTAMVRSEYFKFRFRTILLATVLFVTTFREVNSVDCNAINSCSCSMADGSGVIDLSPLASTDGTPRYKGYKATQPPDQYVYDWNPCQPFTDGDCVSVAGCQSDPDGGDNYGLGTQDSASFGSADDGTVLLAYSSGVRTLLVTLTCTTTPTTFTVIGEDQTVGSTYGFELRSPCACPGATASCVSGGSGLSGGTVFIIIFIVTVSVYLIAGMLYQSFVKNATGIERIPNIGFWRDLPALVKDGGKLLISPCSKSSSYSNI
ncbi:M6PR [Branchiostoma lanceolatum]|uniref:M6PR protein n=1 Tax=Branchiostoma lanceolatum TaxID=7740 RepID=A0A8J9YN26_BRALA|nr:M6PR [Branchiostoma lanceolatum]